LKPYFGASWHDDGERTVTTTSCTGEEPIACTLTGGDYRERLAWIANLNRDALQEQRRNDLQLDLTYRREAAPQVREMVERERACCAFLTFTLREDADATRLAIIVPEVAREAADLLLAPFLSTGEAARCGCTADPQTGAACSKRSLGERRVGTVATATACSALACAACCVLPFALPSVMLTGIGGLIAWMARSAGWIADLALIAVAGGWVWLVWQSVRARMKPAKSTLCAMGIATVASALALGWPLYEASLLHLMARL
jgi:hypothetical protein